MKRTLLIIISSLLLAGCAERPQADPQTIYVSILPLKGLVERITGNDFPVEVLVPAGASPETFEPTPRQVVALNESQLIFSVGLIDFETALLSKIEARDKVVELSRGIELIAGTCSHSHSGHKHDHGIDPHVWTSPRALQQMAANAYKAIQTAHPDSAKYEAAYQRLDGELKALDVRVGEKIAASGLRYFIIYHPALTYYARDYALEQVAVEADGKEPSARRLAQLIARARKDGVRHIFYQNQFPASAVEVIARDIDAQYIEIDPLREDFIANIDTITDLIVKP